MSPRHVRVLTLAAAVALSAVAAPVAEARPQASARGGPPVRSYTAVDLGTPGAAEPEYPHYSSARAINANGQVAGRTITPWYSYYGYVWEAGAVETWGVGSGPRANGRVTDINDARQVVGYDSNSDTAFLWENGTETDLGTPYNRTWGDRSAAEAINDTAQVVGWMSDYQGPDRAFLWANGEFRDLGTLGGTSAKAYDISNSALVVGTAQTASGDWHAFVWENGVMRDLGTLGGRDSEALGVNEAGTIVGRSQTASGEWHAFIWRRGRMRDLRIFGENSVATAVNSSDVVVGHGVIDHEGSAATRAFVWDRNRVIDLTPEGNRFSEAYDINDSGEIVGVSDGPERRSHAFLWRPGG